MGFGRTALALVAIGGLGCGGAKDRMLIVGPNGSLVAAAVTSIVGSDTSQSIRARVTLINAGSSPVELHFGACAVHVLAYATPDRKGKPVWDSDRRRPWAGTYGQGCLLYAKGGTVEPGDAFSPGEFSFVAPLIEMLADSLPDGRYYFSADLRVDEPKITGIAAGSADLAMPRSPLPATRVSDLLTFVASPVTVSGANVRARARATLDYAGSALTTFARDCPIVLYAYRDRARRDAAPRSGAADWTQPTAATCAADVLSVVMHKTDSRFIETAVDTRDILGSSLPSGRYYFAVAVRAQGNRVFLSAGEADLTRP